MEKAMRENVLNALDSMRPFLQSDSGDIELVEITDVQNVIGQTGA